MKSKRWLVLCVSCLWAAACAKNGDPLGAGSKKVDELVAAKEKDIMAV